MDLKACSVDFRIISAYALHCGYARDALAGFYFELYCHAHGVRGSGRYAIVGGDFNTQLHAALRSDEMKAFVSEHGLAILSDKPDLPWSGRWTFDSNWPWPQIAVGLHSRGQSADSLAGRNRSRT